ncbi:MAG: sugar ABC transporter ATP-binding protein [Planctomycetaceae bacterium]|nr:sugar ABC transporter ATP-binding protein [Planctomycetaceae bacterium]
MSLLRMTGISKRFGATRALEDVSFEVGPGEVMALIGENGAGKSTLMKILSGAYQPDGGTMELGGQPYRPSGPHDARLSGVGMIYQELTLAPHLSIEDNILLGRETHRFGFLRRGAQRPRVREILSRLGHGDLDPRTPVSELSVGLQQLVEIGRALALDARVIVFDEPTSSLTRHDAARLFEIIRRLREQGLGIIYISHFLEEVRTVCQRYTVLRDGRSVGSGDLKDAAESQIVSLMVGRSVADLFPGVPHTPGECVVRVEGLSGRRMPRELSLEIRRGEILGIAGLVGAGRTEFLRCLFGLDAVKSGSVKVAGIVQSPTPQRMIAAGLGLVSEDRKGEGLAQVRSIADNLTYSRMEVYSRCGVLDVRRRDEAARGWMQTLQVKARGPSQPVVELSGGNQQKVAIARVLHQDADVLLLDEPTRGIDVGTKSEIYRLMGEAAAAGKAVIFVSSYFAELRHVCDRIAVLARGRLRDTRAASEWTEETLLQTSIGVSEGD